MVELIGEMAPPARTRLKRQSLPGMLAETLQERILNGEFKEGEPLIQDAIAKEYDVSRIPVREALRQLEAAGFVTIEINKGAVVTSVPTEQIGELFDLRALLESDLLARAIPRLTKDYLAAAAALAIRLEAAYKERDIANWGRLNWEFHRSLYIAADRTQTLSILQGINLQIDRYIRIQLLLTEAIEDAAEEHRTLLSLCKAGKVEDAVELLRTHILTAGRELLSVLRQSRAEPVA